MTFEISKVSLDLKGGANGKPASHDRGGVRKEVCTTCAKWSGVCALMLLGCLCTGRAGSVFLGLAIFSFAMAISYHLASLPDDEPLEVG